MSTSTHDLLATMFEWGLDVRSRRVFFHGGVGIGEDFGESPCEAVVKALLFLDKTPGKIELWINSTGGDLEEMFGVYDVIRTRSSHVTTVGFGTVQSAACLLLAAGDKRLVTPNCWFMWHRSAADGGLRGAPFHEVDANVKAWKRQHDRWISLMGQRTRRPAEFWHERTQSGELWLSAKQLVRYGVVDEILPEVAPVEG